MRYHLATLLSAATLIGCASSSDKVSSDPAVETKKYTRAVVPMSADLAAKSSCPKSLPAESAWTAYASAANACVKDGMWGKVEEYADKLAKRDYYSPWGPYYLSLAAAERGELSRATWMLDLALKKAPQIGLFYYQRGRLLYQAKNFTGAVEQFTKARELDPALYEADMILGQIYYQNQDWEAAIPHLQSAVKADAKNATALVALAESYLHKNDSKNAVATYSSAVDAYPENLDYRLKVAEIHEKNQSPEQALSVYRQIKLAMETRRIRTGNPILISERIRTLEASMQKTKKPEREIASKKGEQK